MKYTIITGATSGIGKALANTYAKEGFNLILVGRRIEILTEIKTSLEAEFRVNIRCLQCDFNHLDDVVKKFNDININYQINCLINNAGIGIFESINDISIDNLIKQNNINVNSPILIVKILLNNILNNKGTIINVCSVLSYFPNFKSSIYVANKHALLGFSNSLRIEYPSLHVLTIHPVTVKTNFFNDSNYLTKVKNVLLPNDVAKKIYNSHHKRKRVLNIPAKIFYLKILYLLFPRLIDKMNNNFFSNK